MTNILIPTDFSAASLKMAEQAVRFLNREVNVILFHAYEMPAYYQDFFRSTPPYAGMLNDAFRRECKQLKEQYPRLISRISFQYMQGNTAAIFRNFAEAHEIDLIICPADYTYKKIHERSLNPIPLFRRSRITMVQDISLMQQGIREETMPKSALALATA